MYLFTGEEDEDTETMEASYKPEQEEKKVRSGSPHLPVSSSNRFVNLNL